MATKKVLHMNGGVEETSYANSSTFQRNVMKKVKPILEESLTRICSINILPNCFKVADLGCSCGPNTLAAAYDIINNIIDHAESYKPSFQIFLNDLPGNDFNTLFRNMIPEFNQKLQREKGEKIRHCFIVGTPGTFYGRLFPSNSMHFCYSVYGLHWLSQVPRGYNNRVVPLNKGNIYLTKTSPPAVFKTYLNQFEEDFKLFLSCRSEELVQGGGMILTFIGRLENDELITPWSLIGMALNDMVVENKIEEAKLDSFDVPYYAPTVNEVKEILEAEGSFIVHRLEICKTGWEPDIDEINDFNDNIVFDKNMKAKSIVKHMRAVSEALIKSHFGDDILDELFQRFTNKVTQILEVNNMDYNNVVMSVTKN
ncbi:hypothetical protein L6164_036992 [Bauhinia variegata]|uniref:Uncharacterized protein n=1 Tax=Bauhinia variegata TaxID=167791 RepID=A0ACB9KIS9_BAUVA|nr:hypothetical protein L6164_036992 [Bauhinia variegata]